jgi:GTP-binding protein
VVVHLFDITQQISQVDKKLASYCLEHHKPVVLVGNKVDLADDLALKKWDAYTAQQLRGLAHAPVSFISAVTDVNVGETLDLLFELRDQARIKIPTPALNNALQEAKVKLSPRARGRIPKLFYGTQIGTEPVTVLIFVNEPKLFQGQYQRYLENVLRKRFGCDEVPIQIVFRKREKVELEKL